VLFGAGNAAGGYAVTDRMLGMFKPSTHEAAKPVLAAVTSTKPAQKN
jgi:NAD(P) transhydrogenase subunit alpha